VNEALHNSCISGTRCGVRIYGQVADEGRSWYGRRISELDDEKEICNQQAQNLQHRTVMMWFNITCVLQVILILGTFISLTGLLSNRLQTGLGSHYTQGDSDVISFRIYASWF